MSASSSVAQFNRGHHTTKRFNNAARLKMATHYPVFTNSNSSTSDANNNNNNNNNNSNNSGAVFAHYEHSHSDSLLEALNDLRLSRQLCDVTLIVDQHEYPCHKVRKNNRLN